MIKSLKVLKLLLIFLLFSSNNATAVLKENLTGTAKNTQGSLSYTLPLIFPESTNGSRPEVAVSYSQGSSKGVLGSGFHLVAGSVISRCQPQKRSTGMQGGISVNDQASYCLDGSQLVKTADGHFDTFIRGNFKIEPNGDISSPDSWRVYDSTGYIYEYEKSALPVSSQNEIWHLNTRKDRFENTIDYIRNDNETLKAIKYPGFKVEFNYKSSPYSLPIYSNGSLREVDQLLDSVSLSRGSDNVGYTALFMYKFRFQNFRGYEAIATERLVGVKKCYIFGLKECTNELTFDYEEFTGAFQNNLPFRPTTVLDKSTLSDHANLQSEQGAPAYYQVNIDSKNLADLCFYSKNDYLVCSVNQEDGTFQDNQVRSDGFGFTSIEHHKYYSALNFSDINDDGYADLCIANDQGVKCALNNKEGFFSGPEYVSENLNFESGYQFVDVTRDGSVDLCGAVSDGSYSCFANSGGDFHTTPLFSLSGDFNSDYVSDLKHPDDSESERFKRIAPALVDITGDQIPDFCNVEMFEYGCRKGEFDSGGELTFALQRDFLLNLYSEIPESLRTTPVFKEGSDYFSYLKSVRDLTKKFREIEKDNERITLTFKYQDANSDGLLDICYIDKKLFRCHLNTEVGFSDAAFQTDFSQHLGELGRDSVTGIFASVQFIDINTDGLDDLCFMQGDSQYCGYNTGEGFKSFVNRLRITSDITVLDKRSHAFANYLRARFDEPTKFRFISGMNIYGNVFVSGDLDGDGRIEICMRTIQGVDCHNDEQQSYNALLSGVTDALGNQTRFSYKNTSQDGWFSNDQLDSTSFVSTTPSGLILTEMKIDTGLAETGSQFEAINYEYKGYFYNTSTNESTFGQIIQISDLSDKKQITNFYVKENLTGRVKSVIEYRAGQLISTSVNDFEPKNFEGQLEQRLISSEETQYDPITKSVIRSIRKEFNDFDSLGFAKVKKEINKIAGAIKTITATSVYKHDEDLWILGRPSKETVVHELTGALTQTKQVDFTYYDTSMALKNQVFEKDTVYEKTIAHEYHGNGLLKKKSITGLVDEESQKTRSTAYLYSPIGQQTHVTNTLNQTARSEYHENCLALEKEFDINDRQLVLHTYNDACERTSSTYLNGKVISYTSSWNNDIALRPVSSGFKNDIIQVRTKSSNTGEYSAVYLDRAGRTIKQVKTVSANKFSESDDQDSKLQSIVYSNINAVGNIYGTTLPVRRVSGTEVSAQWITRQYDDYGRLKNVNELAPDGHRYNRENIYDGLTTVETFNGNVKTTIVGVLGKPTSITEYGKTIEYGYTAMGELETTVQNSDEATKITVEYDQYGFKTKQTDPAVGIWEYRFNAFGELYWQKDAEDNETRINYDFIGRKVSQSSREGTNHWYYLDNGNGKGQLDYSISSFGVKRSYSYDNKGRVSDIYLVVDGKELNRTEISYDDFGRLTKREHNRNALDEKLRTPITNTFDNAGRLSQVRLPANKLKSYDYTGIEEQYSSVVVEAVTLNNEIKKLKTRIKYHADRVTYYEAKSQQYNNLKVGVAPDTSKIDAAILNHEVLFEQYKEMYERLLQKANAAGGVNAERKYEFKGYDAESGVYTYGYKECTNKVRRALIFVRCSNYEFGSFGIDSLDYQDLGEKEKTGKSCKIIESRSRIAKGKNPSKDHPSFKGEYIGKYSKKITYKDKWGEKEKTVDIFQFRVCETVKFNVADIFLSVAEKYRVLREEESETIATLQENRLQITDGNVGVRKDVTKYKKMWVITATSPVAFVSAKVPFHTTERTSMSRPDAFDYYSERVEKYDELAKNLKDEYQVPLENKLANKKESLISLEKQKEGLTANIKAYMSLQALEEGAVIQRALEGQELVIWSALSYDVKGKLKDELFGNGLVTNRNIDDETLQLKNIVTEELGADQLADIEYQYTAEGNLDTKTDSVRNISESFGYLDNQLDSWTMSINGEDRYSRSYDYDALGNVESSQSGVTSHTYDDANKPYKVTSFDGQSISYDNKGFITSGSGRSYNWTSFGKPLSISNGAYSVVFNYDAEGSRAVKRDASGTTYYISPEYEQYHKANGDLVHRYHIKNGYQTVATIERFEYGTELEADAADTRQQDKIAYYSRDILGSGVMVTGSRGEVVKNRHYSPYGEAINTQIVSTQTDLTSDLAVSEFLAKHQNVVEQAEAELNVDAKLLGRILTVTDVKDRLKGFTSHEELSELELVHMNARLYDPALKRFVSPDSMIPGMGNPLAYNRYAYVNNNPALAADPSGHFPWAVLAAATYFTASHAYSDDQFHHVASSVLLAIATGKYAVAEGLSVAAVSAGTTLATSAALSGRVGGAEVRAAAFTYASAEVARLIGHGGVGGRPIFSNPYAVAAAHGVAQGTIGWAQNNNFWGSFISGAVSHAVGHNIDGLGGNTTAGIIVRTGITSSTAALIANATGGNAAQAAMTAAMVHLFNNEGLGSQAKQSNVGLLAQGEAYIEGAAQYVEDAGRTIATAVSPLCKGFSEACAKNIEVRDRVSAAIYDYQNDPEVRKQVEIANQAVTQRLFNDPVLQANVAGRGTVTVLVGTGGVVGFGVNALALTGGSLRAAENGGNIAEIIHGSVGLK